MKQRAYGKKSIAVALVVLLLVAMLPSVAFAATPAPSNTYIVLYMADFEGMGPLWITSGQVQSEDGVLSEAKLNSLKILANDCAPAGKTTIGFEWVKDRNINGTKTTFDTTTGFVSTDMVYTRGPNTEFALVPVYGEIPGPFELAIAIFPAGGGTVEGRGTDYEKDEVATAKATVNGGYRFVNWTAGAVGTGAELGADLTLDVTMDTNRNITANFEQLLAVPYKMDNLQYGNIELLKKGTFTLPIDKKGFAGDVAAKIVGGEGAFSIVSESETEIKVAFAPTKVQDYSASLVLSREELGMTDLVVSLSGTGAAPTVFVWPEGMKAGLAKLSVTWDETKNTVAFAGDYALPAGYSAAWQYQEAGGEWKTIEGVTGLVGTVAYPNSQNYRLMLTDPYGNETYSELYTVTKINPITQKADTKVPATGEGTMLAGYVLLGVVAMGAVAILVQRKKQMKNR